MIRRRLLRRWVMLAGMLSAAVLCMGTVADERTSLGLPPVPVPTDNPVTRAKIALGKTLFFDRRLSADGTIRCASCHDAKRAFTDGNAVSKGVRDAHGTRNAPSLVNAAYATTLFWDGRRSSLEAQAKDPFVNPIEHGLRDHAAIVRLVRADEHYHKQFDAAFGLRPQQISIDHVVMAIASFERTLIAGDSHFDRYLYGGDKMALSVSARHGLELFQGRARCVTCHTIGSHWALFTDNDFHRSVIGRSRVDKRLGELASQVVRAHGQAVASSRSREVSAEPLDQLILSRPEISELGRFVVTLKPNDIGCFKTPGLRNVAVTAPYMHDGSLASLEDVVELELYGHGLDSRHPIILTPREKADLVEFLKSLTSPQYAQARK